MKQTTISRDPLVRVMRRHFPVFDSVWQRFPDHVFIVQRSPDGVFRVAAINPSLERLCGACSEQVAGQPIDAVLPERHLGGAVRYFSECACCGEPVSYETHCTGPDGSPQHWQTVVMPATDTHGRNEYLIGISREITALRLAEDQLRQSNEALEQRVAERTMELEAANARLRELAIRDDLTGFFNRRHFFELAEREFSIARRSLRPLALLMLDLDHFKDINDTLGHAAGDQVLRSLSGVFLRALRQSDIVGRYGGEEFAVLLPDTTAADARVIADRLRAAVAHNEVPWRQRSIRCTVSIGAAQFDLAHDASVDVLIERADNCLFAAKSSGRNRLVCA